MEQQRVRIPRAILAALAVFAVVAGVVLGFVLGRETNPATPASTAVPTEVAQMLSARVQAVNEGTGKEIAAFYRPDAKLTELDQDPPVITEGAESIGMHLRAYRSLDFWIAQEGPGVRLGRFVAEPLTWAGGAGGISVYEFAADGTIARQWVIGGNQP